MKSNYIKIIKFKHIILEYIFLLHLSENVKFRVALEQNKMFTNLRQSDVKFLNLGNSNHNTY